jgi:NADH:ubiquinone oxidoreductase subunit
VPKRRQLTITGGSPEYDAWMAKRAQEAATPKTEQQQLQDWQKAQQRHVGRAAGF